MSCRKNIYALSDDELDDFVTAVNMLKSSGEYDAFVERHNNAMADSTLLPGEVGTSRNAAHRGPSFLPWHRYFIREFELALQTKVPSVMLPYWAWEDDEADPSGADLWNTDPGAGRIYIGGDGDPGDSDLVKTGPFSGWTPVIGLPGDPLLPRPGGLIRRLGRDPVASGGPSFPQSGQVGDAVSEPSYSTYDSSPWSESQSSTPSFRNRIEGWLRETGESGSQLHNRVHLWVGGDMLPGTSPNDPVFFLHHCNVDRLWATWQQNNPGSPYLPTIGGPPFHNLNDAMGHLLTPGATPAFSVEYWKNLGYVYDTDAPRVELPDTTVNFNDVPTGETTYRAAVFEVYSCSPVHFEIAPGGQPASPYGLTALGDTAVSAEQADGTHKGRIWFQFTGGPANTAAPSGSATVRCVETGELFNITLTGNSIPRPTVAVMLSLDQSGSMNQPAGTGALRIETLRESAERFVQLVPDGTGLGTVAFDHDAYPGHPFGAITTPGERAAAVAAVQGHSTNINGATSVGDGLALARSTIAPIAGYDSKAIIVFTDGRENSPQSINSVLGDIDDRTFAIGLGDAHQVNTDVLTTLTSGTGGYLLLTGHLTPATDDYFRVTKYFLQILADVTNSTIVTDPSGFLLPGAKVRVPFQITEADIDFTAVALSEFPAIRPVLETPNGTLIDPGGAAPAGGQFSTGTNMAFYRMRLPALAGGTGHAAGRWHLVLEVDERLFKRFLATLENDRRAFTRAQAHGLRYSVNTLTYSNLRMRANLSQDGFEPGSTFNLRAVLTEFGIPVDRRARVVTELERPDGTRVTEELDEIEPGVFEAVLFGSGAGAYRFRLIARGRTLRGAAFTREAVLSGGILEGGRVPGPDLDDDERRERLCRLLNCLLKDESIRKFLEERRIDPERALRCIAEYCRGKRPAEISGRGPLTPVRPLGVDENTLKRILTEAIGEAMKGGG